MDKKDKMMEALTANYETLQEGKRLALPVDERHKVDIEDDYEFSRKMYKELLQQHKENYEIMAEVARDSEHPRAFEVLSKIMKDIADVTDKLMALQKDREELQNGKRQGIDKTENPNALSGTTTVTNNTVFVGSTHDLQKMLNEVNREKVINQDD